MEPGRRPKYYSQFPFPEGSGSLTDAARRRLQILLDRDSVSKHKKATIERRLKRGMSG